MRKLKWGRQPLNEISGEKGLALISVLAAMLLLTLLGLAVTTLGILGDTLSTNQKRNEGSSLYRGLGHCPR